MRQLLLLTAFVLACLAPRATAETVVVRQIGFYFSPRNVEIAPGDTVRWEWTGNSHTVTEGTDGVINGNELWTGPLNSGNPVFTFTFTPAFLAANPKPGGRYDYFCQPHFTSGMTAAIIVVDPSPGSVFCAGDGSGTACPCNNNTTQPAGCMNSVGFGARMRGAGVPSIAADSFALAISGAPESNFVLFFQGSTETNGGAGLVFGDGLRCAGGASVRLGTETISFGYANYPSSGEVPISIRGLLAPGSVRTYQGFYRDLGAACTGAGFNTTNGYAVTWQP
jgi:plastocyanin